MSIQEDGNPNFRYKILNSCFCWRQSTANFVRNCMLCHAVLLLVYSLLLNFAFTPYY